MLLSSADFSELIFQKKSFTNSIDPDQDRQNVGLDLGPNRLQRISADDESRH